MYNKPDQAREWYGQLDPRGERASACIQCRECEDKCPQSIPISEWMPIVHEVLGQGRALRLRAAVSAPPRLRWDTSRAAPRTLIQHRPERGDVTNQENR